MTLVETLLVFLVAPLALMLVVTALVMLPALKNRDRYKPGKPWGHAPVWYEPHRPGGDHGDAHGDHDTAATGGLTSALSTGASPAHGSAAATRTASGGARGTW